MKTCSVEGCGRVAHCKGWCNAHYKRVRRTGSTGGTSVQERRPGACCVAGCEKASRVWGLCEKHYRRLKRTGTTDARPKSLECRVGECDRPVKSKGLCGVHYKRVWRHGDTNCAKPEGEAHHRWRGDEVGYYGAHARVQKVKGKASEHTCVECGSPAAQWAYTHECGSEKWVSRHRNGNLVEIAYSTDPAMYQPMCVPCHTKMDKAVAAERAKQQQG